MQFERTHATPSGHSHTHERHSHEAQGNGHSQSHSHSEHSHSHESSALSPDHEHASASSSSSSSSSHSHSHGSGEAGHDHDHDHGHAHGHRHDHVHDDAVKSISIQADGLVHEEKVRGLSCANLKAFISSIKAGLVNQVGCERARQDCWLQSGRALRTKADLWCGPAL